MVFFRDKWINILDKKSWVEMKIEYYFPIDVDLFLARWYIPFHIFLILILIVIFSA
jgi:hypothetical protein